MKGSKMILALVAFMLIFGVSTLWAQSEYCLPLDRLVKPGITTIKYDATIYNIFAGSCFSVRFEKLDAVRVKLHVKPVTELLPYQAEMSLQWGGFGVMDLGLGASGDGEFILNTETGYAEK